MNLKVMKFGLQEQQKDERDFNAETLGISPSQGVSNIELDLPDFVYSQGQTDMCTAYASSMMMTILNKSYDDNGNSEFPLTFSKADIYAQKTTHGEGAQLRDILLQIKNRGMALDMLYDHQGTFDECKNAYAQNKLKADAMAELGRIRYFYEANSPEDMMKAFELDKPIFGAIDIHTDFMPDANGFIHEVNGDRLGGHAILVVGIKIYNGKIYVKILNSWGESWGQNGCAYIPYEMIRLAYVPVDSNMKVKYIQMQIGTDYYVKNGKKFYMTGIDSSGNVVPVSPFIKDGRTCLPVKFIADAFEAETEWNPIANVVTISG